MQIDIQQIFEKYKLTQEKIWEHDRSKTVGASEIFACIRKGWFEKNPKNKYDPDEENGSWGAMLRGDIIEEHYVVPAFEVGLPEGVKMLMAGSNQTTLIDGLNSATPDGLIVGVDRDALAGYGIPDIKSNCFGLEIKSIDPRSNLHEEKAVHHGQCIQQMGLMREKTKWRPYYTVIVYVDASFLDNIKVFIVPFDKGKWAAAKKRADMIFNTDDPKDLTPEGHITNTCTYCRWKKACSLVQIGSIPADNRDELDEADKNTLMDLTAEAADIQKKMKEFKEDLDTIKQEIKDELTRLDRRYYTIEEEGVKYEARWSSQAGRQTFDKKAAEEAGLDLEPFMKEGNPFEKFEVKVKV